MPDNPIPKPWTTPMIQEGWSGEEIAYDDTVPGALEAITTEHISEKTGKVCVTKYGSEHCTCGEMALIWTAPIYPDGESPAQ